MSDYISEDQVQEVIYHLEANEEYHEHLELLADAFFDNLQRDNIEFGGWGVDSKRPFGNSMVEADIAEIIGWDSDIAYEDSERGEEVCDYLRDLYADLGPFLVYRWRQLKGIANKDKL